MKYIKKGDFAVVFIVIAMALAIFLSGAFVNQGDLVAVVRQNDEVIKRVSISGLNDEITLEVSGEYHNVLVFQDDCAYFKSSDCPNKTCVKTGKLSKGGQSAVCLENRVSITLESQNMPDVVVS